MTKLTNFGVFVELETDLEGLLHISELTDKKIKSPNEVVKVGDVVEVKILRVDEKERKIGLSLVKAQSDEEEAEAGAEEETQDNGAENTTPENEESSEPSESEEKE